MYLSYWFVIFLVEGYSGHLSHSVDIHLTSKQ